MEEQEEPEEQGFKCKNCTVYVKGFPSNQRGMCPKCRKDTLWKMFYAAKEEIMKDLSSEQVSLLLTKELVNLKKTPLELISSEEDSSDDAVKKKFR